MEFISGFRPELLHDGKNQRGLQRGIFNHNGHEGFFTMDTRAFDPFFAFEGHNGRLRRMRGQDPRVMDACAMFA